MTKDTQYWSEFYKKTQLTHDSSDFCNFILKFFEKSNIINTVLDCGCGSGRDSRKLDEKYIVTAIDNCGVLPLNEGSSDIEYLCDDFVEFPKDDYDLIYSRFTFHSITDQKQEEFIKSIKKSGQYLVIETRSNKSKDIQEFHGKNHYRNYTDLYHIQNLLAKKNNFEILYLVESNNFAIYKDENPVCIRVIAKKR
jgi:ubiquinone/menaquinone biosynthesis C-methylase UbiE